MSASSDAAASAIEVAKDQSDDIDLNCRFYENEYPEPEEVVIANVTEIAEMGAYVTLLEYNNAQGMILRTELSRRRIRSINKLVRVNRTEVVMVIRVDKEKKYIDLSKRRVTPEDVVKCEDRYNKAKAVNSAFKLIAYQHKFPLKELYEKVGWPLYQKYGHAYNGFRLAASSNENIFDEFDVPESIKAALINYIKLKLSPQPIKIRADIEVSCFEYEGIDAVKAALWAGEQSSSPDIPIKIKLIAPPMYVMTTVTLDKDQGIARLNQAMEAIHKEITASKGSFEVKMAPHALTQREETELLAMMDRLAMEAEEDGEEDQE